MPNRDSDSLLTLREYGQAAARIAKEFQAVDEANDFVIVPRRLGALACWAVELGATGDLKLLLDHVKVEHSMSGGAHHDQAYVLIPASRDGQIRSLLAALRMPELFERPSGSRYPFYHHTPGLGNSTLLPTASLAVQTWILHEGLRQPELVDGTAQFFLDQPGGLKQVMLHARLHGLVEAALQYCEGFFTGQANPPSLGIRSLGIRRSETAYQLVSRRDGSF
ncbi:hypothetical protein JCM10207_003327 [Rhodosporidiobolus poonsookiae]